MGTEGAFSAEVLKLDCVDETAKITQKLREIVLKRFRKRGVVVGLSGGIDGPGECGYPVWRRSVPGAEPPMP